MALSVKQKALLKKIRSSIPGDVCYTLSVVWISGAGWTERYTTERFIEDYLDMAWLDRLEKVCNGHPSDLCWDIRSEAFEFGNLECGSDPIPADLLALIQEFGLDVFLALPEVKLTDSNSFVFEIPE